MPTAVSAADPLEFVRDVVGGVSIHGLVSARPPVGDAPTLVFVHGLGVSTRYLEPTMRQLTSTHVVAGLDLPGFGRSGTPRRALDTTGLADALAAWLAARGIGPAVFVANSYGCQVIVELTMRYPSAVRGLVLSAPTMDPAHRTVFGQLWRVIADIPAEPWRLALIVLRDYLRARPLRLLATLRHALADHIEEKLPDIKVPVLVVCGALDPVVTLAWSTEAARLVGISSPGAAGATLSVVPTAAHALPYDDPVTFASLITAFAASIRVRARPE
ncbi:hypothetical protein BH11GEM1_BH11GEM1_26130 [soil metagenome]